MLKVDDEAFAFAVDRFKDELAAAVPVLSMKMSGRTYLTVAAKKSIASSVANDPSMTSQIRTVLIDSLSDANRFSSGVSSASTASESGRQMLVRLKTQFEKELLASHVGLAEGAPSKVRI